MGSGVAASAQTALNSPSGSPRVAQQGSQQQGGQGHEPSRFNPAGGRAASNTTAASPLRTGSDRVAAIASWKLPPASQLLQQRKQQAAAAPRVLAATAAVQLAPIAQLTLPAGLVAGAASLASPKGHSVAGLEAAVAAAEQLPNPRRGSSSSSQARQVQQQSNELADVTPKRPAVAQAEAEAATPCTATSLGARGRANALNSGTPTTPAGDSQLTATNLGLGRLGAVALAPSGLPAARSSPSGYVTPQQKLRQPAPIAPLIKECLLHAAAAAGLNPTVAVSGASGASDAMQHGAGGGGGSEAAGGLDDSPLLRVHRDAADSPSWQTDMIQMMRNQQTPSANNLLGHGASAGAADELRSPQSTCSTRVQRRRQQVQHSAPLAPIPMASLPASSGEDTGAASTRPACGEEQVVCTPLAMQPGRQQHEELAPTPGAGVPTPHQGACQVAATPDATAQRLAAQLQHAAAAQLQHAAAACTPGGQAAASASKAAAPVMATPIGPLKGGVQQYLFAVPTPAGAAAPAPILTPATAPPAAGGGSGALFAAALIGAAGTPVAVDLSATLAAGAGVLPCGGASPLMMAASDLAAGGALQRRSNSLGDKENDDGVVVAQKVAESSLQAFGLGGGLAGLLPAHLLTAGGGAMPTSRIVAMHIVPVGMSSAAAAAAVAAAAGGGSGAAGAKAAAPAASAHSGQCQRYDSSSLRSRLHALMDADA